jgi:hypothetical protein
VHTCEQTTGNPRCQRKYHVNHTTLTIFAVEFSMKTDHHPLFFRQPVQQFKHTQHSFIHTHVELRLKSHQNHQGTLSSPIVRQCRKFRCFLLATRPAIGKYSPRSFECFNYFEKTKKITSKKNKSAVRGKHTHYVQQPYLKIRDIRFIRDITQLKISF